MAENLITDFVKVGFNIGDTISAALSEFTTERSRIEAKREAAFQEAVASNTLSPDAQVAYRQQMLDDAQKEAVPDKDYITDLETKLASAKSQAHTSDVLTAINTSKAEAAGGLESNQQYLQQLQGMLGSENDPTLKKSIQDEITTTQNTILQAKITLIQNEASKGATDDSNSELTLALNDAQTQKAQALAVGDTARAASMDVVISSVQQNITDLRIDTENNGLNINKSVQGNTLGYLSELKNLVATSDATTPIKYQGVGSFRQIGYASEQAYWQSVLGSYLNTSFIGDLTKQYDDYVNNAAVVNKLIPASVLDSVKTDFAQMSADPVLAPYVNQLQQAGVQVLGAAVTKNAAAIVDDYKINNDADGAIAQLNSLGTKYGIDVTAYTNEVVAGAAKNTSSGISAIQSAASQYETINSMDPTSALNQAISDFQAGKLGGTQSSKQLSTETPVQALTQNPASAKTAANTPPVTMPIQNNTNPTPAQINNEPSVSPLGTPASPTSTSTSNPGSSPSGLQMSNSTPKFTSFVKTLNSPTVYGVDANGQHVAFENEQQFKQSGGTDNSVKVVSAAPQTAVNFSQYNPLSPSNSATQPGK